MFSSVEIEFRIKAKGIDSSTTLRRYLQQRKLAEQSSGRLRMNGKSRFLILQIGFAKVLALDSSCAQLVLPAAKFGFVIYAQNYERAMMRSPFSQLWVRRAAQHKVRQRVTRLHRTLRAGQVQTHENV